MINILDADLHNPVHASALLLLLNQYACDPMGGSAQLSDYAQANLIDQLRQRRNVRAVLAFVDEAPAGLAICIEGFSTFACKPLLNIHDLAVSEQFRGMGIGKRLIERVAQIALSLDCCKITLEVLQGNHAAQALYKSCGFAGYALDPKMGTAVFLQRKLRLDL
ncbi:MAG: GNAT family N-acetyltransferase [Pseudomonadota bacterium]